MKRYVSRSTMNKFANLIFLLTALFFSLNTLGQNSDCERLFWDNMLDDALENCLKEEPDNERLQSYLGDIYKKKDEFDNAYKWYMLAADRRDPWTVIYRLDELIAKHGQMPKNLIQDARTKNRVAIFILGSLYRTGTYIEKDEKNAFESYSISAELGLPIAMYYLSLAYQSGMGVDENDALSDYWEKRAAYAGHPPAQEIYADHIYFDSFKSNDHEAFEMYLKAANEYMEYAQYRVGRMYNEGLVVKKDIEQAKYWLNEAVINNSEHATEYLIKNSELNE